MNGCTPMDPCKIKLKGCDEERLFGRTEWSSKPGGSYRWTDHDYCRCGFRENKSINVSYCASTPKKSRRISYPVSHVYQQGCPGNAWKDWTQREQKQKNYGWVRSMVFAKKSFASNQKTWLSIQLQLFMIPMILRFIKGHRTWTRIGRQDFTNQMLYWTEFQLRKQFVFMERISGQPEFRQWWSFQRQTENRDSCMSCMSRMFQSVRNGLRWFAFQYVSPVVKVSDVLHKYQHKFRYILVDEFQDTNFAQYCVEKLSLAFENICVVGDAIQSDLRVSRSKHSKTYFLWKRFPDLRVFKLEQNYRSTKTSFMQRIVWSTKQKPTQKMFCGQKMIWREDFSHACTEWQWRAGTLLPVLFLKQS